MFQLRLMLSRNFKWATNVLIIGDVARLCSTFSKRMGVPEYAAFASVTMSPTLNFVFHVFQTSGVGSFVVKIFDSICTTICTIHNPFAQYLNQFRVRQFRHFLVESQRGESRVIVCRRDQSIQQTTTFCRCQRIERDLAALGFNQTALKHAD